MNIAPLFRSLTGATFLAALLLSPAGAATLTLNSAADGYIRANQTTGDTKNTTNTVFLVGDTTNPSDYLRGVLSFDLNAPALEGATINSVTLTLKIGSPDGGGSANASATINLHQLAASFDEGTADWTNRSAGTPWSTPGGDYGAVLANTSANASTAQTGNDVVFSGAGLTNAALSSVGGTFYLLVKLNAEDNVRNIFRFGSGEGSSTYYPALVIDYTAAAIPEPSSYALLGGFIALGAAARRRRAP